MSFKPPLWPHTAIFHCSYKTCSIWQPFHCCQACLFFPHWYLESTFHHWMYFTVSLHLFHSLDSSISPNFRYFKSDYGQDFKTWVGKGAPGNRTSCVELLVPTPWDVNMLTTADWQAVPVRVPSCAVSLRAHVLHLGDYFCYTGVAINYVCYSPFTVGTFPFIILFLFFRGCTVWSKSHYPQHCWQREVNTSMGSHGSINLVS